MRLLVLAAVLWAVTLLLTLWAMRKSHSDIVGITCAFGHLAALIFIIALGCCFADFHLPVAVSKKQIEMQERYRSIMCAVTEDKGNYVVLSGDIADYNAEVRQGRYLLDSAWVSCLTYPFWDDIPLIEP